MVNEAKLRRRVLLRMFGSPFVVAPFVLGMTALTAIWAVGWSFGIALFAGAAGLLTAAGAGLTRLLLDAGTTGQTVRAEMEQEEQRQREAALDELDRRLVAADEDPRPELALRDLRALLRAFEDFAGSENLVALHAVVEVRSKVQQLFDESIDAFEETLKLGAIARELKTEAAHKSMLAQRDNILKEVNKSIRQISEALRALQHIGVGGESSAELARLREELDDSLSVANKVESRIHSLLDEPVQIHQPPIRPQAEEKQKGT